ncbi:flagellar biosynthesis protein FliQ [Bradyrhizobium sp. GM7.3]
MTGPETLDVARDAIWTIVIVSSPLMVVGLVVGVVVSLFQALTQIQEQTLIYVPKILAIFATMLFGIAVHGRRTAFPHAADIVANHRRLRHYAPIMRIDVSLLPALAASFMLAFARVGAMVMLLPGLGETNIPTRIKLSIALLLTLIILPLHRNAYQVDMGSIAPLLVLMLHEIVIGIVLGATARVTLSALQVAGAVIAQQMGLGFVTSVDPTQGQQGVLVGNFLTILGVTPAVRHR